MGKLCYAPLSSHWNLVWVFFNDSIGETTYVRCIAKALFQWNKGRISESVFINTCFHKCLALELPYKRTCCSLQMKCANLQESKLFHATDTPSLPRVRKAGKFCYLAGHLVETHKVLFVNSKQNTCLCLSIRLSNSLNCKLLVSVMSNF